MVDVRFGNHRRHRGVDIARVEFVLEMRFPQCGQIVVRAERGTERGDRALMGHARGGLVEMIAAHTRERVIDPGIHVHFDAVAPGQRIGNALLRVGRAEAVLPRDLQHEPAVQVRRLVERVLDAHAVADRRGHVRQPARGEIRELAAETVAEHAGSARAFGKLPEHGQRGANILDTLVLVVFAVKGHCAFGIRSRIAEFDPRRLAPEQVGHEHRVAFLRVVVGRFRIVAFAPKISWHSTMPACQRPACSGRRETPPSGDGISM